MDFLARVVAWLLIGEVLLFVLAALGGVVVGFFL